LGRAVVAVLCPGYRRRLRGVCAALDLKPHLAQPAVFDSGAVDAVGAVLDGVAQVLIAWLFIVFCSLAPYPGGSGWLLSRALPSSSGEGVALWGRQ
jgi:hypothetical protein